MPLADRLFRRGHLSEQALTRALVANERPAHVDRCIRCAERMAEIGRWLDRLRDEAVDAADAAFPAERLAVQQAQILRRIAQAEEPVRVLEFPGHRAALPSVATRRVAPAWLAVAAAAGLVVGVVSGQMSARLDQPLPTDVGPAAASLEPAEITELPVFPDPELPLFELDLEGAAPVTLRFMDESTPTMVPAQYALSQ
jgi:hypothetical protein